MMKLVVEVDSNYLYLVQILTLLTLCGLSSLLVSYITSIEPLFLLSRILPGSTFALWFNYSTRSIIVVSSIRIFSIGLGLLITLLFSSHLKTMRYLLILLSIYASFLNPQITRLAIFSFGVLNIVSLTTRDITLGILMNLLGMIIGFIVKKVIVDKKLLEYLQYHQKIIYTLAFDILEMLIINYRSNINNEKFEQYISNYRDTLNSKGYLLSDAILTKGNNLVTYASELNNLIKVIPAFTYDDNEQNKIFERYFKIKLEIINDLLKNSIINDISLPT